MSNYVVFNLDTAIERGAEVVQEHFGMVLITTEVSVVFTICSDGNAVAGNLGDEDSCLLEEFLQ